MSRRMLCCYYIDWQGPLLSMMSTHKRKNGTRKSMIIDVCVSSCMTNLELISSSNVFVEHILLYPFNHRTVQVVEAFDALELYLTYLKVLNIL